MSFIVEAQLQDSGSRSLHITASSSALTEAPGTLNVKPTLPSCLPGTPRFADMDTSSFPRPPSSFQER